MTEGSLLIEQKRLLEVIEDVDYGEITVKIRQGKPVLVERGVKTIKLEDTNGR